MNSEENLKNKLGEDHGFKVPNDFFEQMYSKISSELPEKKADEPKPLTMWQRIRPYVYLAAMFAGIWCMMKMFHTMTSPAEVSLENPPAAIAEVLKNPEIADEINPVDKISDDEIIASLEEEYDDFDEFVADFGYEFDEDIADIDFDEFDMTEFDEELSNTSNNDNNENDIAQQTNTTEK